MSGYISEFRYYGNTSEEFVEIALPTGTDPSGYRIIVYMNDGTVFDTYALGSSVATLGGHDVYVIDASTPGFPDGGADPTGNFYPDDALALVDGSGTVVQFVSYWDNTVTAVSGPAAGLTSTDVGTSSSTGSLQSDDGGATYFAQESTNAGTIPACYATGSLIATRSGDVPIEQIAIGDYVRTDNGTEAEVLWVWSETEILSRQEPDKTPVLIRQGALGRNLPQRDLIVSGQHRICVGGYGQLEDRFGAPCMVPAKALVGLRGVRFMAGKRSITWFHLLCRVHSVIFANGAASETLYPGDTLIKAMPARRRAEVSRRLGRPLGALEPKDRFAMPVLSVGAAKRRLVKGPARAGRHPQHPQSAAPLSPFGKILRSRCG